MKSILVLGAGRSATALIDYLLDHAQSDDWKVFVADMDLDLATDKVKFHNRGEAVGLDVGDEHARKLLISRSDIVISMLPPSLHYLIAQDCLASGVHLLTASYLGSDISDLDKNARQKGLLFMMEMGLDPGIDHMSAMAIISRIKGQGGEISAFRSYTGGLISRESDDNPWHYKITWNPRNVVLAGQNTARFRIEGQLKFVPHFHLFQTAETIVIPGEGAFEMYPNRDSLPYASIYSLSDIPTIVRGTLRHIGFCKAWAALVALGLTDDHLIITNQSFTTFRALLIAFLPFGDDSIHNKIKVRTGCTDDVVEQIKWLFDDEPLPKIDASIAELLQYLLVKKWALEENDQDLVVMHHEIKYVQDGKVCTLTSSMVKKGHNKIRTAMTDLVGLPLGICARLLLNGTIRIRGVHVPITQEVYCPILDELHRYGVHFKEQLQIG